MKVYYDPISEGFYHEGVQTKFPSTAVEISQEFYEQCLDLQAKGFKVIANADGDLSFEKRPLQSIDVALTELAWRNLELKRADVELNKVQDGDTSAIGSVGAWRSYRKDLRKWPENNNFPDSHFRPKAPDNLK